jgi:cell division protein FtsB
MLLVAYSTGSWLQWGIAFPHRWRSFVLLMLGVQCSVHLSLTETSKDIIIAAKNKRIKELEAENKQLKDELKVLRGKLYESLE